MKPTTLWRRYLRTAEKAILLVKQHELHQADFKVEWLEETITWIREKQFVTDPQKTAIDNTMQAVKNMIRYRKFKEKRRLKRGEDKAVRGRARDGRSVDGALAVPGPGGQGEPGDEDSG